LKASTFKRYLLVLFAFLLAASVLSACMSGAEEVEGEELSVVIDCEANRKDEAEAVAADLRKIGIQAEARTWEWSAMKEEFLTGSRQMYMTDWGSAYFDPFDIVIPKLKTGERGNYSFYSNGEVDNLLDKAVITVDDEERAELYRQAQEIIFNDAPWIFGYCGEEISAFSASVGNWEPSVDSRINLHDVTLEGSDVLTVGLGIDKIVTLDPGNYRDRDTETVLRNIYDALLTRKPDGEIVEELAESWEALDPTTYIFKLRKGVVFHNGEALTADDVVFTFERILSETGIDGMASPRLGLLGPLSSVEKVDDYTVKFTLSEPFPVFTQALCHFQIVPKDYIESVGDAVFAQNPVGSGPFKYKEGRLDDQVVLERFDDYYGGAPAIPPVGPAPLKTVIFRMMPDPSTRVSALMAGEVQLINKVPSDMAKPLENDSSVVVQSVPGTRAFGIEFCNTKPPFDDVRVRQALNYAVNWNAILESIYGGNAERLSTVFLPSGFGFDENLKPYEYNPEKAVELLQQAGIKAYLPTK
jgi:peptide/nickel transport system substrate-binding protein